MTAGLRTDTWNKAGWVPTHSWTTKKKREITWQEKEQAQSNENNKTEASLVLRLLGKNKALSVVRNVWFFFACPPRFELRRQNIIDWINEILKDETVK